MEEKLLVALRCQPGSKVLDAGCGAGHVALYMAEKGGLQVECIDITPHHLVKAERNIRRAGMSKSVSVQYGDYNDLSAFDDGDFDGVYTMETLVHSSTPRDALKEFWRILKPGGRVVMHEYDHHPIQQAPKDLAQELKVINRIVGMPAFDAFEIGDLARLARQVGFENVEVVDMSKNIRPMAWLFYIFAYVPLVIFRILGLQYYFINTLSAVDMYRGREYWRYTQVTARKPL